MKKEMELIRRLMLQLEGEKEVDLKNYTQDQIDNHKELLIEAELVHGSVTKTTGGPIITLRRLTWEGHDFLEKIRNETVWQETKKTVVEKGMDVSISVLKALATKITMDLFG